MLLTRTLHATTPIVDMPTKKQSVTTAPTSMAFVMPDLLSEVQKAFESQLDVGSLLAISTGLQAEFRQHMVASEQCMLPSFNYDLPTGQEKGVYLAVEVGGSNLRMALVDLFGRHRGPDCLKIRRQTASPIAREMRHSTGYAFFDWMASQIREMLASEGEMRSEGDVMRMGVAWSFPIDQTSIRSGNVLGMGKGFRCSDTIKNQDLSDIIHAACQRQQVNVRLDAIVNDTSSTLLARAYLDPATRLAVVLGTGMNAAIHLPIAAFHPSKFDLRGTKPDPSITHVLTNTELSMFGKDIFPRSRWDEALNTAHIMPNYQPFEYLIAGGYMSEIVRRIMVDAAANDDLYVHGFPKTLLVPYSLDTHTLARIQLDKSAGLTATRNLLHEKHQSPVRPSFQDAAFIQKIVGSVSRRSIAYFAAGVHALTSLLQDLETEAGLESGLLDHVSIGCDGSVINKYPGYMEAAQETLDQLQAIEAKPRKRVLLEKTQNSTVLGAAVAGALAAASSPG